MSDASAARAGAHSQTKPPPLPPLPPALSLNGEASSDAVNDAGLRLAASRVHVHAPGGWHRYSATCTCVLSSATASVHAAACPRCC
eukprot:198963-Chlamydomonas_euryale.AAC.5